MSQENVEVVRRCYEYWTERDLSAFQQLAHPDVVIDLSRNVFNPAVYRGVDGFRHLVEQVDEMWEDFHIEPDELIDADDTVVSSVRLSGRGRGSGVETEMRLFGVWTFREGRVSRFAGGYRDRAAALEAAGLSESAMSEENVEVVRDALDALGRGGLDAMADYLTDDIDHRAIEGAPDDPGPIHGKDAMRAYAQDWLDTFDDFKYEPIELTDAGEDKVIAVVRVSGRAKLSGVETDLTFAVVITIRDGKIARGREYWTRDEALEAAGLSE